ncbi:MAG: hypothetical protein RR553_07660, partial [Akkermansia sp.]
LYRLWQSLSSFDSRPLELTERTLTSRFFSWEEFVSLCFILLLLLKKELTGVKVIDKPEMPHRD